MFRTTFYRFIRTTTHGIRKTKSPKVFFAHDVRRENHLTCAYRTAGYGYRKQRERDRIPKVRAARKGKGNIVISPSASRGQILAGRSPRIYCIHFMSRASSLVVVSRTRHTGRGASVAESLFPTCCATRRTVGIIPLLCGRTKPLYRFYYFC